MWQEDALSPPKPTSKCLLIAIHGLKGSSEQLKSVAAVASEALGVCDTYVPQMAYHGKRGALSSTSPASIVCELVAAIDALNAARADLRGEAYERVFVIGYSMGALVARKFTVIAHGQSETAPFEPGYSEHFEAREWAARIQRVVLLGGISRGWSAASASNWLTGTLWSASILLATLSPARRGMIMETRFGLPFSVQTRLQWLALGREKNRGIPVVQLLGSKDDIVSPNDMMDVAVDGVANQSHVLLDMPQTGHAETVHMGAEAGAESRRQLLTDALTMDVQTLANHPSAISSALLADGKTPEPEEDVTDVVFVVHGIRDKGFWTAKLAREIKRIAAASPLPDGTRRHVRSMTESYGYLAMLPFLWVGVRRAKAAWLMDRYVDAKARYPNAAFHYVGHSNGTYLAARALQDYPAARFERVVFAGSVVRSGYAWEQRIVRSRQVDAVMNYVASSDLVVGIFPAAFGWFDLGGAGHTGFRDLQFRPADALVPRVFEREIGTSKSYQVHFAHGGHGAGIVETQWDEIARFIVNGSPPHAVNIDYVGKQARIARILGTRPPFGFLLCLMLVFGIGWLAHLAGPIALSFYLLVLVTILLRV